MGAPKKSHWQIVRTYALTIKPIEGGMVAGMNTPKMPTVVVAIHLFGGPSRIVHVVVLILAVGAEIKNSGLKDIESRPTTTNNQGKEGLSY